MGYSTFTTEEKIFFENFYKENNDFLIGPEVESFKPKYRKSNLMNGETIDNKPLFSFKFGLIITMEGSYVRNREFGYISHVGGNIGDLKIESYRLSLFSFSKTHFLRGAFFQLRLEKDDLKDIDVFYKFVKEYKIFYEGFRNREKLINSKGHLVTEILKLEYGVGFKNAEFN